MSPSPSPERILAVDGVRVTARIAPLWWQRQGRSFTASGYGRRIPTPFMVRLDGRWRRVYCCVSSNAGTCYVEGPRDPETGKRPWRIVTD